MKNLILFISLFLFNTFAKTTVVKIAPWISYCKEDGENRICSAPSAYGQQVETEIEIKEVYNPGDATFSEEVFSTNLDVIGKIKTFSIFPHENSPYPPYVQFQIKVRKPIELICSHTISFEGLDSIPPIICASKFEVNRFGMTITFEQKDLSE